MTTGEILCICFVNNFFLDFILLDMKQVQAKACMSVYDVYHLPLRLPTSPVKIQIHPPPKVVTYWSGSYVGWLPRTLSQVEVGALLQDFSQLPDTLVFSFRKTPSTFTGSPRKTKDPLLPP